MYDIFETTNLSANVPGLNLTNWAWVFRTSPGQTNIIIPDLIGTEAYFRAAQTNDFDGDGMSTAFEALVSHSDWNNADQNTNGIPDGWEWNHFGNLNQTAEGDYDGDGISNLQEYLNGTNPNDLSFSLSVTNRHTRFANTPMQLHLEGGVPAWIAVLVDDTNFAGATWNAYATSNLTVNLGATEGWHGVWIGLKGRAPETTTKWQWKRLKLDTTPPILVVTNPGPSQVSAAMIQLEGYAPEALAAISCDLTNAAGLFPNQMILVLDQHFDRDAFEFRTNTFQAFDLDLTNGLNTFILSATDLAGNTTTTEFNVTLNSDTNAPTVNLIWPQDGFKICGDNFTLRGRVDDPSATVTISWPEAGGGTNSVTGLMERDGKFWGEHLPLANGTNTLTVTATDVWNNVTVTNLQVIRSAMVLTIAPVPENQLWQKTVSVHGTISEANRTVWVNGVLGTNHGDGTWSADHVPVTEGGTATFTVRAYEPGEPQP